MHITTGRKGNHSAFWSEPGGNNAMVAEITLMCEFFDIDQGSVEIGNDCESELSYIFKRDKFIPTSMNSFDVIMMARKVLACLQVQHTHRHIPAHQSITRQEIDIWGRPNDDCNTEVKVKSLWKHEEDKWMKVTSMKFLDEPWALWIGDEHISTQV
jgi:hypothetical protein